MTSTGVSKQSRHQPTWQATAVTAADRFTWLEAKLVDSPLGISMRCNQPLARFTTYRVGGPARIQVTAESLDDLTALGAIIAADSAANGPPPVPVLLIGMGSNLLVADEGFKGVAVLLGLGLARFDLGLESGDRGLDRLDLEEGADDRAASQTINQTQVTAGGATRLPVLARACAAAGLRGLEWAVGVPGTVGGAVRMNAGGHGADTNKVLVDATIVDLQTGKTSVRPVSSLDLRYRHSNLKPHEAVAQARLRVSRGGPKAASAEIAEIIRWRRLNQPGGRNTGSVFANPEDDSAGRLIETAGAKGLRVGSAQVSNKHANFIQADEHGRASDIVALMAEVHRRVLSAHNIDLRVETRLAGFKSEDTTTLMQQ